MKRLLLIMTGLVCATAARAAAAPCDQLPNPIYLQVADYICEKVLKGELRNGDRLREKLLELSDFDMLCTYSILDSPMPLTNYVASLRLTPVTDQDRTFIEWSADFDCAPELEAELVSGVGGNVFQTGFDALNRAFGA